MTSYQDYVDALIPANRRGRLKKQLDFDHGDNDDDLREIAKYITDWEIKLVTSLGLAPHEITDIKSAGALPLQRFVCEIHMLSTMLASSCQACPIISKLLRSWLMSVIYYPITI